MLNVMWFEKKEIAKFFECNIRHFENCDYESIAVEDLCEEEIVSFITNRKINY